MIERLIVAPRARLSARDRLSIAVVLFFAIATVAGWLYLIVRTVSAFVGPVIQAEPMPSHSIVARPCGEPRLEKNP